MVLTVTMSTAQVLAYVGLSNEYRKSFFKSFSRLHGLCTRSELAALDRRMAHSGKSDACYEVLTWAMTCLKRMKRTGVIDTREIGSLEKNVLGFRRCISALFDYDFQPIPFAYCASVAAGAQS